MSEEAILNEEDVEQGVEKEVEDLSPRQEIYKRIEEKQRKEREPEEEAIEEPEPEEVAEEPEEPEAIQEEDVEEDTVEIKVNGELQRVPKKVILEQGIRAAQKDFSADRKLEEANRRFKELLEYENKLKKEVSERSHKESSATLEQRKKDFAKALVEDEETAANLFADAVKDVGELRGQVRLLSEMMGESQRFVQEQRMTEAQKMNSLFNKEFGDLNRVPELRNMVNERTKILLATPQDVLHEHGIYTKEDILMKAGNDVRQFLRDSLGVKEEPEPEPDAVETKKKMPQPLKKAVMRQPAKKEEKPLTTKEIIARMKDARTPHP